MQVISQEILRQDGLHRFISKEVNWKIRQTDNTHDQIYRNCQDKEQDFPIQPYLHSSGTAADPPKYLIYSIE
jgi:hypothetical protein